MPNVLPERLLRECSDGLFVCTAQWANNVTGGWFWQGMMLAFALAIFVSTQRFGSARSFGIASFVFMMGSAMLGVLDLVPTWYATLSVVVGLGGLLAMSMNRK